jgi:hypothetical protein
MTYQELKNLDRAEIAYLHLISKMRLYNEQLEKITLCRMPNKRDILTANICCHMRDRNGRTSTLFFRLPCEQYLWFCTDVSNDFPETPFEDLTEEKYKLVKEGGEGDIQTNQEVRL